MKPRYLILAALILAATIPNCTAIRTLNTDSYDDYIITYYNSSYIETVNWQYVQIAGSDEEIKPEFVGLEVVIDELAQTGPTSCIAIVNLP